MLSDLQHGLDKKPIRFQTIVTVHVGMLVTTWAEGGNDTIYVMKGLIHLHRHTFCFW